MSDMNDYIKYGEYAKQVKEWNKRLIEKIKVYDLEIENRKLIRKAEEIANGYMTK